ncbi:hypothetical protein JYP50_04030 [Parahaliea mediterranea]|uniref:Uncharacterized protein n=1 Tax=Parahaliea mediterranea TaxID=651086 RepID=A0A939DCV7_9GAMM|nr:hypothetical protein [Parahaliea mediterranea]
MTYARDDEPGSIDIALVALDDAGGLAPQRHIWVKGKPGWVSPSDGLSQYLRSSTGEGAA